MGARWSSSSRSVSLLAASILDQSPKSESFPMAVAPDYMVGSAANEREVSKDIGWEPQNLARLGAQRDSFLGNASS